MPRLTLTLESDEQYIHWLEEINKAVNGQSKWICAMVERSLENPKDFSAAKEIQNLREENNKLKAEKEMLEIALEKERSLVFKLQAKSIGDQKLNVAEVLRRGGHWNQRELMEALHINPTDMEAMQIVRKQLEILDDSGFIEEKSKGWRWVK